MVGHEDGVPPHCVQNGRPPCRYETKDAAPCCITGHANCDRILIEIKIEIEYQEVSYHTLGLPHACVITAGKSVRDSVGAQRLLLDVVDDGRGVGQRRVARNVEDGLARCAARGEAKVVRTTVVRDGDALGSVGRCWIYK